MFWSRKYCKDIYSFSTKASLNRNVTAVGRAVMLLSGAGNFSEFVNYCYSLDKSFQWGWCVSGAVLWGWDNDEILQWLEEEIEIIWGNFISQASLTTIKQAKGWLCLQSKCLVYCASDRSATLAQFWKWGFLTQKFFLFIYCIFIIFFTYKVQSSTQFPPQFYVHNNLMRSNQWKDGVSNCQFAPKDCSFYSPKGKNRWQGLKSDHFNATAEVLHITAGPYPILIISSRVLTTKYSPHFFKHCQSWLDHIFCQCWVPPQEIPQVWKA